MIDVATTVKGAVFKTDPFVTCLEELSWTKGEGMMNALVLFNGMCNNNVYCPTMERISSGELKMVWEVDDYFLVVYLHPIINQIRYAACKKDKPELLTTSTIEETYSLLEYWASFLNQDDKPNEPEPKASIHRPR